MSCRLFEFAEIYFSMEWLNYHHLFYFWTVVNEGSVTAAAKKLRLAPSTISAQMQELEEALDEPLFYRVGRRLELTEMGRIVHGYAQEIFTLGREMLDTVKNRPTGRPIRLFVGIVDVLPKVAAYHLLQPVLGLPERVQLVCYEDRFSGLLPRLAAHEIDVILSDTPVTPLDKVRAYNHELGESGVSVFGTKELAAKYHRDFPRSLDGAPLLLPTDNAVLRRTLDEWFDVQNLRPAIVGEFDDSALVAVFGQSGAGLFFSPTVLEADVVERYSVQVVGRLDKVRQRVYAVSAERKVKHPAVMLIARSARETLFQT